MKKLLILSGLIMVSAMAFAQEPVSNKKILPVQASETQKESAIISADSNQVISGAKQQPAIDIKPAPVLIEDKTHTTQSVKKK
jgi:hypothetical protein